VRAEGALDPPGGVAADLDPRLALDLADLPVRRQPVRIGVEVVGQPEVALAPGGEADIAADPRDAERLDLVVVEV